MRPYIGNGNASQPREGFVPNPKLKLLDQVSEVMRFKHYSLRTEQTYREWIKRFILFNGKRHPRDMGPAEISRFLSDLAVRGRVAASTQNQAFNALLFLYREVLHLEMGQIENVERASRPARLPVVLSKEEAGRVLGGMTGTFQLNPERIASSSPGLSRGGTTPGEVRQTLFNPEGIESGPWTGGP